MLLKINYGFYRYVWKTKKRVVEPDHIYFNDCLSGYGYNVSNDDDSSRIILYFGGSTDIAYNSVAKYAAGYKCPFLSVDYYGSQKSRGHMKLLTMKKTATDFYDWVVKNYPGKKIVAIGHSYGTGMAAYLASVRRCEKLILVSAYRDFADLYNRIIPVFWGPFKKLITNNISICQYAKNVTCQTHIIGSTADITLGVRLQKKIWACFKNAHIKVFTGVKHAKYLTDAHVVSYIKTVINKEEQD